MQPGKPSFIKPTLKTKFHIDYEWWEREESGELRSYLLTHLEAEKRDYFLQTEEENIVDYVNPETGEVFALDELGLAIQEAALTDDFINPHTSLVDSIFRVFLANGNMPLDANELAEETERDARTILKTLGGIRIYKGIRPIVS